MSAHKHRRPRSGALTGRLREGGRVEGRRVTGRVRWLIRRFRTGPQSDSRGHVPPPALRTRRADFRHRALQWNHAARTRVSRSRRAGGSCEPWHQARTLALVGRYVARPGCALTTATTRVVPFAYACDDVRHCRPTRNGSPSRCAKLPHTAAEDLLELVMRRYERASTILTSNRPVEGLGEAPRRHRRRHRAPRPPAPSRPRAQVRAPSRAHQGPDTLAPTGRREVELNSRLGPPEWPVLTRPLRGRFIREVDDKGELARQVLRDAEAHSVTSLSSSPPGSGPPGLRLVKMDSASPVSAAVAPAPASATSSASAGVDDLDASRVPPARPGRLGRSRHVNGHVLRCCGTPPG